MKKILVIFGLMMSTMCVYAVNFALSDGDFGLNANITREGDNVRLQYKINGMSSVPETPEITAEQRQALSPALHPVR